MLGTETGHLAGGATEDTAPPLPTESVWQAARTQANAVGLSRNQVVPRFPERSLLASCADAARKWPDHPSISSDGRMVTYRQLWDVIQHIAGRIDQSGAPDGPVAIMLEDALLYSAAILGVLAAGRVVLPIDMSNPLARNLGIMEAAGVSLVLASPGNSSAPAVDGVRYLVLDDADLTPPSYPLTAQADTISLDAPAILIATSGSTGAPKLVVHGHRGMGHRADLLGGWSNLSHDDRIVYGASSPGALPGLTNLFASIFVGGTLHHVDLRQVGLRGLMDCLKRDRITFLRATPSLVRAIATMREAPAALAHLRCLRLTGEAPLWSDVVLLRPILQPSCLILNTYGSTESLYFDWRPADTDVVGTGPLPAGRIDPAGEIVLLAEDGSVCPIGEVGELVMRSRYLALGEWRDGRCVAGRLFVDSVDPSCRVYFTGDLGRISADGNLVVLGRKDRQLKINGLRVELGEIEATIHALGGIRDAVVLPIERHGATTLLAFVVLDPAHAAPSAASLREALRDRLPVHMLPSRVILLGTLPRLSTAKADRAALLKLADGPNP